MILEQEPNKKSDLFQQLKSKSSVLTKNLAAGKLSYEHWDHDNLDEKFLASLRL